MFKHFFNILLLTISKNLLGRNMHIRLKKRHRTLLHRIDIDGRSRTDKLHLEGNDIRPGKATLFVNVSRT